MKSIRVYFCDFWQGFNPLECSIGKTILDIFPNSILINEPIDVDLCVFSCFGNTNTNIDARYKISYIGEPHKYKLYSNTADLEIGFDYPTNTKQFRFPLWKWTLYENCNFNNDNIQQLMLPRNSKWSDPVDNTIPFCALYRRTTDFRSKLIPSLVGQDLCASYSASYTSHLVSHDYTKFLKLTKDYMGNYIIRDNLYNYIQPGNVNKKIISKLHPFHLALENCQEEGYVTEKLFEPLYFDTLPFYWGDERASKDDFNPNAFISISHFNSNDDIQKINHYINNILKQPSICAEYRKAPIFIKYPEIEPLYDAIKNVVTGYD